MLITHNREKLLNTIIFFAQNTEKCGKTKLFKLLYFLDFEHYKITGRSVTGLDYYAWKMGPVPVALYDEINSPEPDMAKTIHFNEIAVYGGQGSMLQIKPCRDFDASHFSRRELKIMNDLATQYQSCNANDMVEATHLENLPWSKIFYHTPQALIPYDLALRSAERDDMLKHIAERQKIIEALS